LDEIGSQEIFLHSLNLIIFSLHRMTGGSTMQAQIIAKPAFTVVGMRIQTRPKSPEIPELWGKFGLCIDEVPHAAEADTSYGVMYHSDQTMDKMEYMAGLPVEKVDNLPAGMTHWDLSANTYAVFETTLSTITHTFD
jgi:AraC family transcriptional regulator